MCRLGPPPSSDRDSPARRKMRFPACLSTVVALTETLYQHLRAANSQAGASVLCPPYVNTRIFQSVRNRPGAATRGQPTSAEILQRAVEPGVMAEAVFDGIKGERLYILSPSEFDHVIQRRFDNIMARRNRDRVVTPVWAESAEADSTSWQASFFTAFRRGAFQRRSRHVGLWRLRIEWHLVQSGTA